ncbi:MAG: hypothetical protein AMJ55_00040 [Gammaproteobacteria bacterium SG8_15]|nr:MAG: hypothetical protein AMJ55_00040 [Gammaproteobacteria bacterium SG8_15]
MSKKYTALVWVVFMLFTLTACEVLMIPQQEKVEDEAVLEKYKDVPMREVLNKVQADFAKAKNDSLYFYSPNNYRTARIGIQTARAYFNDPERKTQVLRNIYKTEMAIKDAYQVKEIVDRELSEVIALRISLDNLEAKKFHGREYQGLATTTASLVEQIEIKKESLFQDPNSKTRFEEQKKELIAALKDFRVRVVKEKYLKEAENLIAEAGRYDAQKLAPVTHGAALKSRDEAIAYIENNIENLAGIQQQSEQFGFAAHRLMHIAREIANILALKEDTYEQYVLREEERLTKISEALKTGDIRNQNFSTQASQLAANARQMVRQKEANAMKIAEMNSSDASVNTAASASSSSDGPQPVAQQAQPVVAVAPDPLVAGVAGGDLETLKNSVRILTDQLYKLTLENSELKSQRDVLTSKLKKLETESNQPASAKTSSTTQSKPATPQSNEQQATQQSGKASTDASSKEQSKKSTKAQSASTTQTQTEQNNSSPAGEQNPASTDKNKDSTTPEGSE